MSLKLRAKYQYRNVVNFLFSFKIPTFLTSTTARIILLFLVVIAGLGDMLEINKLSTTGFVTHNLEKKVLAINSEIQKIEVEVAGFQSMTSIQTRLKDLAMVPAGGSISFVKVGDSVVARR